MKNLFGYTFNGKIKNGKYNGVGQLTHNQRDWFFDGKFEDNWPSYGKETYSNYTYEGEFYKFILHGNGRRVLLDGTVQQGEFNMGTFID